jgi:hypothetical protein
MGVDNGDIVGVNTGATVGVVAIIITGDSVDVGVTERAVEGLKGVVGETTGGVFVDCIDGESGDFAGVVVEGTTGVSFMGVVVRATEGLQGVARGSTSLASFGI